MYLNKEINQYIKAFTLKSDWCREVYLPIFFRIEDFEEEARLIALLEEKPYIQVFDTIYQQLTDLIKGMNPSVVFSDAAMQDVIARHLNGVDVMKYGVWVYYPWLEKVVHMLDEKEHISVRTNRNKHKITQLEQDKLSQKKIGVIGLSVGQSVSLTLAIERGCGELRIADFDVLDLTNLNRIRSGVQNINLRKTVIVAREIAEIDPFLKVTCYHEGITEENIDAFLTNGGNLDLLIDECDSFDIKISCREKARSLGIPVLMEGSDRCTIDIERFDLEPERPILHGYVKDLDMGSFKSLKTMDEKIPYIAPVTGIETLSPRMKASAIEIMSSISTWPQLASAVTYGGGVSADVSRKILLGSLKISGRFFIDIDELIADKVETADVVDMVRPTKLTELYIEDYLTENFPDVQLPEQEIAKELISDLVLAANKAPSGGNNQPWRWHYRNGSLHLFLESSSAGAYLDPDFISSYTSIGAAIQNLLLKAAEKGIDTDWRFTTALFPVHIASFNFKLTDRPLLNDNNLALQINDRHTNRKAGNQVPLTDNEIFRLQQVTESIEGVKLCWVTDEEQKRTLGSISGETDLLRIFIPQAHTDFITKEMRWTQEQIEQSEDGIGIDTLDLSNSDQIGLRLVKDERAIRELKNISGGKKFKNMAMKQFVSSSAIGLITLEEPSALSYIKGGMAAEKLWLRATEMGYQIHPINVPIIFFYRQKMQYKNDVSPDQSEQIEALHKKFMEIFGISSTLAEVFLFRIFKAEGSERRTIRKSLPKTLSFGKS